MLRLLAAYCYRTIYVLHHKFCLRRGLALQNSKLVVVGSYRTGGAGKTPFCMWLCNHLAAQGKNVALLCHEYAFDEIAMLREKFSDNTHIEIIATRNRYKTAHELDKTRKFDIILCDDGFEDSRLVEPATIILSWENSPTQISELWPSGRMRSLAIDHKEASITLNCYGENPDLQFVIDKVATFDGKDFTQNEKPVLLCGIGDPERFKQDLAEHGIETGTQFVFKDHCRNFAQKMEFILKKDSQAPFIITEKDAARVPQKILQQNKRIYIATQKAIVRPSALQKMKQLGL
jgi:tetraacyldisaccharide 4'-kinase